MNIDERIARLICELEYKIGSQTYNPNSYNGWTGEEGQEFKYPVNYCASKKDLKDRILSKTKRIESLPPECIGTMKYKFGSNHLYIGDGIVKVLEHLENVYGLDFNALEDQKFQKKIENMNKMKSVLDSGETIEISRGRYLVGEDIPEGEYVFVNDTENYMMVNVYYKNGNEKKDIFTKDKEISVKIKKGETVITVSALKIRNK